MNKLQNSWRRLKFKLKHDYLTVENVVLAVAILLCLVWTYQSITAMSRNWELAEMLTTENKKLELLKVEVDAAEVENKYYETDEYKELLARKYLDKKAPGENMVVMPDNSETAIKKHEADEVVMAEKEYSNFEKWMMYLFPNY